MLFQTQLTTSESSLETCLSRWKEYSESMKAFSEWLAGQENLLKDDPPLQPTLEDKQSQLKHYQVLHGDFLPIAVKLFKKMGKKVKL